MKFGDFRKLEIFVILIFNKYSFIFTCILSEERITKFIASFLTGSWRRRQLSLSLSLSFSLKCLECCTGGQRVLSTPRVPDVSLAHNGSVEIISLASRAGSTKFSSLQYLSGVGFVYDTLRNVKGLSGLFKPFFEVFSSGFR